jgi:hypothetical protein
VPLALEESEESLPYFVASHGDGEKYIEKAA